MHIDQHRERLRERIALLAALVEGAYVATIASASERSVAPSGRMALLHDDIVSLSQEVQAEATQFLVRFRPVASDLHFATAALGCCADLQVAAIAADLKITIRTVFNPFYSVADNLASCRAFLRAGFLEGPRPRPGVRCFARSARSLS